GKIPPKDPAPADDSLRPGFDPEEINPPVATKGGLTALLHAARQGYVDAAKALVDGGAPIDQVGAGDGASPLLMAVLNGQFDMAMFLIERGANPNVASKTEGVTPLWAAINTEWQPRTRYPQPEEMERQKATYLDVAKALLDRGADPNTRITAHPWYLVYSGCGNRNCGLADTTGSTAFWRAAYGTDVDAMRLLVSYGADPNIPTIAPPRPVRRRPHRSRPQRSDDGRHGERSGSTRVAVPGDRRAAREAWIQEQPQMRFMLTLTRSAALQGCSTPARRPEGLRYTSLAVVVLLSIAHAQQPPPAPPGKPYVPLAADALASNSDHYVGENVTLTAAVGRVLSRSA